MFHWHEHCQNHLDAEELVKKHDHWFEELKRNVVELSNQEERRSWLDHPSFKIACIQIESTLIGERWAGGEM
jgi:hypothetical protein